MDLENGQFKGFLMIKRIKSECKLSDRHQASVAQLGMDPNGVSMDPNGVSMDPNGVSVD